MLPKAIRRFNRTTLLTIGFLVFLAGLGLSRFDVTIQAALVGIFAVLAVAVWRRRGWVAVGVVLVLGLGLGMIRGAHVMSKIHQYDELYGQKVVMLVTATEDSTYGSNSQITFDATDVQFLKPLEAELPGRIKISGFGENMIYRGDIVEVEGKLSKMRGGRQGIMSFAALQVHSRQMSPVDKFRREFGAGMQSALPEPAASFGLGILIGQRSTLPDDVAAQLAAVGLTHIIAVSGYNLTIIVDAVRRLTAKLSKYQSTLIALGLLGLFLLTTGMSASIVRASIVSGLGIWAWYYGRTIKPVLLISFAATLTAAWNPLYLWGDIGWYLSFLAFFGVLVIAPLVTRRLYKDREPRFLQAILIETTCAQIMTLPLILYIFQQVSVVSLLANILVIPLVPIAMLVALIAGLAGMLAPAVAGWFAWPAQMILTYVLDIANILSRVPHALVKYSLSLVGLLFLYGVIIVVTVVLWRKIRQKAWYNNREGNSDTRSSL
jgi:competence protein ComEC